jgi:hypothetical protein
MSLNLTQTRCTRYKIMWKICQWLTAVRWSSLGTQVSSTNKTDRHDITEILLKVALNTIILKVRMWYIMFISDIGCVYLSRFIFVVSFQMKLLIEYMKLVLELLPGKRRRCHVTWPRNSMLIIKIKIITMN